MDYIQAMFFLLPGPGMKKSVQLSLLLAVLACLLVVLYLYKENVQVFLKAHSGDADAQSSLGTLYYKAGDLPAAAGWYKKAAEQSHTDARYNLGVIYQNGGEGLPKDEKEAALWYEKAAKQGHILAQYNFGLMYAKGQHVPQSFTLAFSWFEQAAMHGLAEAQYTVGEMYEFGDGPGIDLVEAYKWFALAKATDRLAALETKMIPDQIVEAQKRVAAWKPVK